MADDILKDSRFTKYLNDPRYREIPRHERKVKIDKRFQSMFKDEKFKVKYTVDKRGRPVNETSTENLRRYYDLEFGEESSDEEEKDSETIGKFVRRPASEDSGSSREDEPDIAGLENDTLVRGKIEKKLRKKLHDLDVDYARGEGFLQTDSSSDESSGESEVGSDEEHAWGELDADAEATEDATKRLAVCNMDWDNIKASDIMVLFNSFLPPGGVIHKVTIYPSEYGLQRMKDEEVRGPIELVDDAKKEEVPLDDDGGNEEGSTYNMEKLRKYQLNRLRYYYAVVETDCAATADRLYAECDGMEYESSSTKLDLRFIPDDTTFDQELKEECSELPDMSKYKPRLFTTTALQQAKVELTWDATNPNRTDVIRGALGGKIDDIQIKEYLASSSDEEEDKNDNQEASGSDNDDPINKYKSLLQDIEEKESKKKNKDMEMEITWGLGVKEKADRLVKETRADDKNMTPFEKQMQKRREKKKQKKLERKQKIEKMKAEQNSDQEEASSDNDIPSDIDMNDPYFAEEFNKPEFKKEKKIPKEKLESENEEERKKLELELLIDNDDIGKAHFSLKKIQESEKETKKSKRKRKLKDKMKDAKQAVPDFDINVNDERFEAIFKSHHYNIDPTDPNFKKTKNMEKLINEKLKRRPTESEIETPSKKTKEEAQLSLLVRNIKRKTKAIMSKTQ